LESRDFVSALQIAISIGGDDTIACIAGSIAEAFCREIPPKLIEFAEEDLTPDMRDVITEFRRQYVNTL
jgi:ADP-ribosylglycohydrolase